MIDERERLGRLVTGFAPPDDAFERLVSRRGRKQRNQRLAAGAVGVLVALAAGVFLVRALTSSPTPANPPEPRPAPVAAGTLAYILDGDVYVADQDGSNAEKILDGHDGHCGSTDGFSYWAEGSMWSPDGRYLAFRRLDCSLEKPGIGWKNWGDVVISDAAGNVLAAFPADGWDIGWSPDSTRIAVWDTTFEKVGVYGVDGTRVAQISMPSGWSPSGDHDPAWLPDGTLAVDDVELPLDGSPAVYLDFERANEWRDDYLATVGQRVDSPDGSLTAYVGIKWLIVAASDGSASTRVRVLKFEPPTTYQIVGFSPEGNRLLFSSRRTYTGDVEPEEHGLWSVGIDGSEDARLVVAGTMDGDWFVPSGASESAGV
jgi:Tol biopolymer transport system component